VELVKLCVCQCSIKNYLLTYLACMVTRTCMSAMHPWTMFLVVVTFLSLAAHESPMYIGLMMRFSQTVLACCSVTPPGAGHLITG